MESAIPTDPVACIALALAPFGAAPIGLAVSGGVDSMVLLEAFAVAHAGGRVGGRGYLLHVEHGLRADGATDLAFVQSEATRRGLVCVFTRVDVRRSAERQGGNIEDLARTARYRFFANAAQALGLAAILTAHHKDDQIETIAFRLERGAGLRGLSGIEASRPLDGAPEARLVRPLLEIGRREIETWARQEGLEWRVDPTNADVGFRRNALRHEVLPSARAGEQNAGSTVDARLLDLARTARELDRRTSAAAGAWIAGHAIRHRGLGFSLRAWRALPRSVAHRVLEEWCRAQGALRWSATPRVFGAIYDPRGAVQDVPRDLGLGLRLVIDPRSPELMTRIERCGDEKTRRAEAGRV